MSSAFNRNLSLDRFTVDQITGDVLPNATIEQKIASGFNRNHRGNSEGGIISEESAVEICDGPRGDDLVWSKCSNAVNGQSSMIGFWFDRRQLDLLVGGNSCRQGEEIVDAKDPPRRANKARAGATSFGRTWMC